VNWGDFFHMGGYAFHVWTSWGISLLALLIIVITAKRRNAKIKADLARQIRREEKHQINAASLAKSNKK